MKAGPAILAKATFILAASIAPLWAQGEMPKYQVVPIQEFNLSYSHSYGAGNVFGGMAPAGPWIERGGVFSNLPVVTAGLDCSVFSVNRDGQMVGSGKLVNDIGQVPVRWEADNTLTFLGLSPLQPYATAFGVGDGGHAAGMIHSLNWWDNADDLRRAAYWAPDGTITVINSISRGIAWDVNNKGWVTGFIDFPGFGSGPFLRKPGQGASRIPIPTEYAYGVGSGINDWGEISGYFRTILTDTNHAFHRSWDGEITMIPPGNGYIHTEGSDLNELGVVVGSIYKINFDNRFGMVWTPTDEATDVNDMLKNSDGWTVKWIESVNEDGVMAGQAVYNGIGYPVKLVPVSSLLIDQLSVQGVVFGGGTAQVRVQLSGPAPLGGATIHLTDDSALLAVQPSILIPEGATEGFATLEATPVGSVTEGRVRARLGLGGKLTAVQIQPPSLVDFVVTPQVLNGGQSATGSVMLTGPAPSGGFPVSLSAEGLPSLSFPSTVTVAAGNSEATFQLTTTVPLAHEQGVFRATVGTTVLEKQMGIFSPTPGTVAFSTAKALGEAPLSATITLSGKAPVGGATVQLAYPQSAVLSGPASVVIPAGEMSKVVTLTTSAVASVQSATVQASRLGTTASATIEVVPSVTQVTLSASSAKGGQTISGIVHLGAAAPVGGLALALKTTLAGLTLPAGVTVPAGKTATSFSFLVRGVNVAASGTVKATYKSRTVSANLSLVPPSIQGLALPYAVVSGMTVSAGVTLDSWASLTGSAIATTSSHPTVAAVPATATVKTGTSTVGFPISTRRIGGIRWVTIKVSLGKTSVSGKMLVLPKFF